MRKTTIVRSRRIWLAFGGGVIFVAALGAFALREIEGGGEQDRPTRVKIKRVHSGYTAELDTDEELYYAGIRGPHANEPLFEEAKQRNGELVSGKKVRLRFDANARDKKGHLLGYAFLDDMFVNEALVKEGLAFARITTSTQRFRKELLAAQQDARDHRRGLWQLLSPSDEQAYPADPKYGNFHRPSCAEAGKIKPERLVTLKDKEQAFNEGYAPCDKCLPF